MIKAFNDDLPYDQFIREQLAADRLNTKNPATLAALGFLTLGDHFNGQTSDVINDRIDVTSKAFLGLTVSCARCHDHKFDPIPHGRLLLALRHFRQLDRAADRTSRSSRRRMPAYADYLAKRTRDGRSRAETHARAEPQRGVRRLQDGWAACICSRRR